MKSLLILAVFSFALSSYAAGPDPKVKPGAGPDQVETEWEDNSRGEGSSRPEFGEGNSTNDSGSPWGDVYGERDESPQFRNVLEYLFGCTSLFTSFQVAGS